MISEQTYKDLSIKLNAIRNDPLKQKEVAEIKKQQNDMFDDLLDPEDKESNTETSKKSTLSKIKSIIKDKKIAEEKMDYEQKTIMVL